MTLPPRKWATDTNFASGPDTGLPTRVDPGAGISPQGFIPHAGVAAQHVNYLLGSTIDYLHELEDTFRIDEDFVGIVYDFSGATLTGDYVWRAAETGSSPVIAHSAGRNQNPGQLVISLPTSTSFTFFIGTDTGIPTSFATFKQLDVVLKIDDDPANLTTEVQFGLTDDAGSMGLAPGNDVLTIRRAKQTDATHWVLRVIKLGVQTETVLTSAAFTDNKFVHWRFVRLATGAIEIYFKKDTLVHTVAAADVPTGNCNLVCYCETFGSDVNVAQIVWDRVKLVSETGDRSDA